MLMRLPNIIIGIVAICGLSGCMTGREFRRRQEDPRVMVEENEREQRAETADDIERLNRKDAAEREKQLNDLIDRQLRR
jgi:hypothetical protein